MAGMSFHHQARFATAPLGVYFDHFQQEAGGRPTLLLLHGGGHTGSCWLTAADGRPGWAYRFAAAGYPVAVPDWPGHGRSGALNFDELTGETVCQGIAGVIDAIAGPVVLVTHSMGGALGWRVAELRAGRVRGVAGIAPGPPGNIQPEGEIVQESDQEIWVRTPTRTGRMRRSGATIMDREFVERKLVGASRYFPAGALDAYARMLTCTGSRLLYERQNTKGTQVRVQNPACFAGKTVLVLTGDADMDHPRDVDGEVADWLRAQGAEVAFTWLADHGISGNGHMLMMEANSDAIADMVLAWLDQHEDAWG
jgi:pimeloyl-ACP methyl ester carboxylesterase